MRRELPARQPPARRCRRFSRTGSESAVRTWPRTGWRSAALTFGGSTCTGSATRAAAGSRRARARSSSAAAARSSTRPVLPAHERGPQTPAARWPRLECGRSITRLDPAELVAGASARSTECGGVTSAPKTRTPIRREAAERRRSRRPGRMAALTAASQSAWTPRFARRSRQLWPAAVKTTGTLRDRARAGARASRSPRPDVSPPTSTPAIFTPAATRSGEPANRNPSRHAEQPLRRSRAPPRAAGSACGNDRAGGCGLAPHSSRPQRATPAV